MCQLAFWREHARFPEVEADIAPAIVEHLARQIGVSAEILEGYDFAGRSGRRHRRLMLAHLAVREFGEEEEAAFRAWLLADCLPAEPAPLALEEAVASWFARERILRPGGYRFDRLVRSARAAHDDAVLAVIAGRLDDTARERLDALLADDGTGTPYTRLSADAGKVGIDSLLAEIDKLALVRGIGLPRGLLSGLHPDAAKRLRRRAAVESAWELRRHPRRIRLPLLAAWILPREAEIVDALVELLILVTHRITVRAERKVVAELIEEARTVRGKTGILFKVASAVTEAPDGVVREVIFPVVDERTFQAGVLRHDTDAEIDRTYVDSHGQSEVAFAFCKLLGFQLLPRLKNIAAQRLSEAGVAGAYANLSCILTRSIDWELVEQQYDEMVRYGTASHRAHRQPGNHPAAVHEEQRRAPDLPGTRRAGQGDEDGLPLSLPS